MITIIIIVITVALSFYAFSNTSIQSDCMFYPTSVTYHNKWYRFVTCGFIHKDETHLIFNMISLYMFGDILEKYYDALLGNSAKPAFIFLYISSLVVCLIPTYLKNKHNYNYASLGASGAVSAVVFSFILLEPLQGIGLLIIPGLYIPAFIFGFIYLGVTAYLNKRGSGTVNHSAHFWGALYGVFATAIMIYLFTGSNVFELFFKQVTQYIKV